MCAHKLWEYAQRSEDNWVFHSFITLVLKTEHKLSGSEAGASAFWTILLNFVLVLYMQKFRWLAIKYRRQNYLSACKLQPLWLKTWKGWLHSPTKSITAAQKQSVLLLYFYSLLRVDAQHLKASVHNSENDVELSLRRYKNQRHACSQKINIPVYLR